MESFEPAQPAVSAESAVRVGELNPSLPPMITCPRAYQAQVRAWEEVVQTVSYARSVELPAHERLAVAVNVPRRLFAGRPNLSTGQRTLLQAARNEA
ncbi:MAG TPA: hypothetical protein VFQ77_20755 [Pseudonocardiaceae bacterium]|jgi:hypothetical protein|nr:hypothetical protein [Pseudonocardiaceae bacterium]